MVVVVVDVAVGVATVVEAMSDIGTTGDVETVLSVAPPEHEATRVARMKIEDNF